jgi:SAM-dependent methyltransferase
VHVFADKNIVQCKAAMWKADRMVHLLTKYKSSSDYSEDSEDEETGARGSGYDVTQEVHLKGYFYAMLDDEYRYMQYKTAITNCIRQFIVEIGRPPRVLDVGIGTGLLSAICLLNECEHVVGVDINDDLRKQANENLSSIKSALSLSTTFTTFTVAKKLQIDLQITNHVQKYGKFDIFISEILGSFATSENMHKYLSIYTPVLNTFENRKIYCVPQKIRQQLSARYIKFEPYALQCGIESILDCHAAHENYAMTNTGGMNLHLHMYDSIKIKTVDNAETVNIHGEDYIRLDEKNAFDNSRVETNKKLTFSIPQMENYTSIGIFEWDVTLWGDVHVLNTVDTLSTLPPRVALANHLAWGQAIFKLHIGTNALQFTGNLKTGTGKPIFNHTIFPIPIVKHGSKWYLSDDANWKKTKKRPAETLRLSKDMSLHDLQETGISLSASDASMIQRMTSSSAVASSSVPASSSESQSHSLTIEFQSTIQVQFQIIIRDNSFHGARKSA